MKDIRGLKYRADEKWGHPEAVETGTFAAPILNYFDYVGCTHERLDALSKGIAKDIWPVVHSDAPGFGKFEWTEHFTEKCLPEHPELNGVRVLVGTPKDVQDGELLPTYFVSGSGCLFNTSITAEVGVATAVPHITKAVERCVIVSLDITLCAPEHHYPGSVYEDLLAYQYMIDHAEELHVDTDRIVLFGISNMGYAALTFAFWLRDRNWYDAPMPRGIVAVLPVMDDVSDCDSMRINYGTDNRDTLCNWDGPVTTLCMKNWLGDRFADPALGPEAVPNRITVEDLEAGYPPVWFITAELDPGRDAVYKFASCLNRVGIFCDLHVWGGTNHTTVTLMLGNLGERESAILVGAARDAATFDLRRSWLFED